MIVNTGIQPAGFKNIVLFIFFFLAFLPCIPAQNNPSHLIQSLIVENRSFDPGKGQTAIIKLAPTNRSSVTLTICDESGYEVKVLVKNKVISNEEETIVWDGRNSSGKIVPNGIYFFILELEIRGKVHTYNPYYSTYGKKVINTTIRYDYNHKHITYYVPEPAMVRIRVGLRNGGPLLGTLLDWSPKDEGTHTLKWNGSDPSGYVSIADLKDRLFSMAAFSLGENALIVNSRDLNNSSKSPVSKNLIFSPRIPLDRSIYAKGYFKIKHEPRIDVHFTGDYVQKKNMTVINGDIGLKITVHEQDRIIFEKNRFELIIYIDTVFLFEDESAIIPYVYNLEVDDLSEGEHIVTINLLCYDFNCGVVTKKILLKKID